MRATDRRISSNKIPKPNVVLSEPEYEPIVFTNTKYKGAGSEQKNKSKRNSDTHTSDLDHEPIVSRLKRSKYASNKHKNMLKTNTKSDSDSSNTNYEPSKSKPKKWKMGATNRRTR